MRFKDVVRECILCRTMKTLTAVLSECFIFDFIELKSNHTDLFHL